MANKIIEDNEQVVYDSLFMSEPEFGLVYGELYKEYTLFELKEIFHRIRDKVIDEKISYNRKLKKTRLNQGGFGDIRISQGSEKKSDQPKQKVKEIEEEDISIKTERKGSLKGEILALYNEGKTKSQIRDSIGCKYQYVFQTVKKYEETKKMDS